MAGPSFSLQGIGAQFGGTNDWVKIWCWGDDPTGTYFGAKLGLTVGLGAKAALFAGGNSAKACAMGGLNIGGRIDVSGMRLEIER